MSDFVTGMFATESSGAGSRVEWGTVGEWFSGTGGLLAVIVAVGVAVSERRRANHAEERTRKATERLAKDSADRARASAQAANDEYWKRHDAVTEAAKSRALAVTAELMSGSVSKATYRIRNGMQTSIGGVKVSVQTPGGKVSVPKLQSVRALDEATVTFDFEPPLEEASRPDDVTIKFVDHDGNKCKVRRGEAEVALNDGLLGPEPPDPDLELGQAELLKYLRQK